MTDAQTSTNLQLGAVLPHNEIGSDAGAIRAFITGVEAAGATHLLVYDHVLGAERERPGGFVGPYDKTVAFHEPLTFLSFAAALTTRLELVTNVLILPQRQAALVAKQAAEVAVLSGGRFRLGVGSGWNAVEYDALGVPMARRGARLEEQIVLMRRLWDEEIVDFDGAFHHVDLAGINPRPARPIPIWFGGGSTVALQRCARLGDGWMPLGGPGEESRAAIETIAAERARHGLTMDGFGIQAQAQFRGGDPDRWRSVAGKWANLGATHLAVATHNAGDTDADGHVQRVRQFIDAVSAEH